MTDRSVTQSDIKSKLSYDPITGLFRWINSKSTNIANGSIAGSLNPNGYIYIGLYRHKYRAHRLAWIYMTGKEPENQIDHINGVRSDNRFSNLRLASNLKNTRNRGINSNNKSGYRGVSWSSSANKWVAHGMAKGKRKNLGYFETAELASQAFEKYAKQNHGEFYRDNS